MKKLCYASVQLCLPLVAERFGTVLAFFYLEKLCLSAAFFSLTRTVYAFWDAINDPLFGHLSDRTKTRLGRLRPSRVLVRSERWPNRGSLMASQKAYTVRARA
ncbi:MFS transporter [Thermus scotoductus]|uniref:MFS transporter n=1 Tax=Thermus scotoductus TaxID=37636 RepID=UPI00267F9DD4